jgi:Putative DNA-binding domain/NGO1945 C-terminal domain
MSDSIVPGPFPLADLQRWMQSVITSPTGVEAGLADSDELAGRPASEQLEKVITRSRNLSAWERIAVYHNAYYARLLQCLRGEFPILLHAVTEEVFDAFAFDYLQKYPSKSYTLGQLGAQFTRYLAATRSEQTEAGDAPSWEDFVIDLAVLEWTYGEVFDGPGVEGEALLDASKLATILPEHLLEGKLITVPCLRLLAFRFPVHEFYSDVRNERGPSYPDPAPTFLAINRRDLVVENVELSEPEFRMLSLLDSGQTILAALESITSSTDIAIEDLAGQLQNWFQRWAAEGFFREFVHAD